MLQPIVYGVMLDNRSTEQHLRNMSDVIRNALHKAKINPVMEEESIIAVLHESLCDYTEYAVSSNARTIGLSYYLELNFSPEIYQVLFQDKELMGYLELNFINAYSGLRHQLGTAIEGIHSAGGVVDEIDRFVINTHDSFYTLNSTSPELQALESDG